jgi:ArsR family transcriptional regulator
MDDDGFIAMTSALAQQTRLATFRCLVAAEPAGVAAGELARRVGVPQNTMSTHLAVLARAELIIGERQSRSVIYRARLGSLRALMQYLIRDCCDGRPEICAPHLIDPGQCCTPSKQKADA